MHVVERELHGYKNRALPIRIDVETDDAPEAFTNPRFRISNQVEIQTLPPYSGGSGVLFDVDISSSDLDFDVGKYRWELIATHNGETVTLALGTFELEKEPTTAPA